ncbi:MULTISPECIES: hypothetical protein [Haloferax]|uniref:Uncharacterized protein n=1 Tax=Haloferax marinum TaxID=2666143 RepID=A0A6A8G7D7_9EURY|nr:MULTISPECIES: hypothetical protein [Haloferax]KAB1198123.1 hypothetical protein Hfx1150_11570 [Haloferax sp. CBA1150]MRW97200.1 hypothetical protein [Haloferax marinum]
MLRNINDTIPLSDSWESLLETPTERVYEHSERYARMQIELSGSTVTSLQLFCLTREGWDVCVDLGMEDRSDHPDALDNEIVLDAVRMFAYNQNDFPPKNPESSDVAVGDDDAENIDESDEHSSRQTTLDNISIAD